MNREMGFLSQQFMEASHLLPQETSRTWHQIYKAKRSCTCGKQHQGHWVYTHPIALTFPPVRSYTGSRQLPADLHRPFSTPL
jgi:hypothetical protein